MIYDRFITQELKRRLNRPFVDIIFGARQTGKTCLLRELLRPSLSYNLADPTERSRLAGAASISACRRPPESPVASRLSLSAWALLAV